MGYVSFREGTQISLIYTYFTQSLQTPRGCTVYYPPLKVVNLSGCPESHGLVLHHKKKQRKRVNSNVVARRRLLRIQPLLYWFFVVVWFWFENSQPIWFDFWWFSNSQFPLPSMSFDRSECLKISLDCNILLCWKSRDWEDLQRHLKRLTTYDYQYIYIAIYIYKQL